jgi:hypothetical protein
MKKIIVVVADGCVESVFTDLEEEVELEIVDFDSCFDSRDEQEALADYVDGLRDTMKEI